MAPTGPEVSNRPNSEALSGGGNWQGLRDRMCIIISGSPSWNFYYTPISRGVKGTETKHKNKGFHWHLLVFVTVKTTYKTEVINNCSSVLQKIQHKERPIPEDGKNTKLNRNHFVSTCLKSGLPSLCTSEFKVFKIPLVLTS